MIKYLLSYDFIYDYGINLTTFPSKVVAYVIYYLSVVDIVTTKLSYKWVVPDSSKNQSYTVMYGVGLTVTIESIVILYFN